MDHSRQVRSYRRSAMDGSSSAVGGNRLAGGRYPFCSVVLWDRTVFVHGAILFMKVRL